MSEFTDAIAWRGVDQLTFTVYCLWPAGVAKEMIDGVRALLEREIPNSKTSLFVATDEDWPCVVGVFDIDCDHWPTFLGGRFKQLLTSICKMKPYVAWMMFEGVFNSLGDIFHREWAPHVYAILRGCDPPQVDLAIDDQVRQSPAWAELIESYRMRLSEMELMGSK